MELSHEEYVQIVAAGGRLWPTWDPNIYRLDGMCPFLQGRNCSVRETKVQPRVCRKFGVLGDQCRKLRLACPDRVRIYTSDEIKQEPLQAGK